MTDGMKRVVVSRAHHDAYAEVHALMEKYAGNLGAEGLLAVAANIVGKIAAMQDQRVMTPQMVAEVIEKNIEQGNAEITAHLRGKPSGRA